MFSSDQHATHQLLAVARPDVAAAIIARPELAAAGCTTVEALGLAAVLRPVRKGAIASWLTAKRDVLTEMLATQRLLEAAQKAGPLLAAAPGSSALGPDQAMALLAAHVRDIATALEDFGPLAQFQLSVRAEPTAFLQHLKAEGALAEAVRLGEGGDRRGMALSVQKAVLAAHGRLADTFMATIRTIARDVVMLPMADHDTILNCVVLIGREDERALDAAIEGLDKSVPDCLLIRYAGPLPAVSFAALAIEQPEKGAIAEARLALGLSKDADPTQIRAAYHAAMRSFHGDAADVANDAAASRASEAYRLLTRHAAALQHAAPGRPPLMVSIRREGDVACAA
jgi:hypothetical protein